MIITLGGTLAGLTLGTFSFTASVEVSVFTKYVTVVTLNVTMDTISEAMKNTWY